MASNMTDTAKSQARRPGSMFNAIKERIPLTYLITSVILVSVSICCLLILSWIYVTEYNRQISNVKEKHLLLAKNLAGKYSRYAEDSISTFEFYARQFRANENAKEQPLDESLISDLLTNFNFKKIIKIEGSRYESIWTARDEKRDSDILGSLDLGDFAGLTAKPTYKPSIVSYGSRQFFVLQTRDDNGSIYIAYQDPLFVRETQNRITFGRLGHAAIFDRTGKVIAHPVKKLEAVAANASSVSAVKLMMEGKTGVTEFFSPPMNADMIAGYTSVPGPGWGVMVPQPIQELQEATLSAVIGSIYVIAAALALSIILGSTLGYLLLKPLKRVTAAAKSVSNEAKFNKLVDYSPVSLEIRELTVAFNRMLDVVNEGRDELRLSLAEAVEANKLKDTFLATVGHELVTPLNGVVGMLTVASESNISDDVRGPLEIAQRCAWDIKRILDDILIVEKLNKDNFEISETSVQLQEFLGHIEKTYTSNGALLKEKVEVAFECKDDVAVWIDETKVRQIIINLLTNAIKFTKVGEVRVCLGVEMEAGEKVLTVSVRDTGIGIDPRNLKSIFRPFFQVDTRYERENNGLGLGLFICKRLAEAMRGCLDIKSELGVGTIVSVKVPASGS